MKCIQTNKNIMFGSDFEVKMSLVKICIQIKTNGLNILHWCLKQTKKKASYNNKVEKKSKLTSRLDFITTENYDRLCLQCRSVTTGCYKNLQI